jgi:hypothetical protein
MKHEISNETLNTLSSLKMKALLVESQLCLIQEYTIERLTEIPKKTWLNRHPEPKKKIYLTSIKIWSYNEEGKFLGTLDEEYCYHFILRFNLYYYRNKWVALKEALNALGYDIVKAEKKEETKETTF